MNIRLPNNSSGMIVEIKGYRDKLSDHRLLHTVKGLREYKARLVAAKNKLPKSEREYYEKPLVIRPEDTGSIFGVPRGGWHEREKYHYESHKE